MNCYKNIHFLLFAVVCICAACSKDWTEPKAKQISDVGLNQNPQTNKSDAYYAELRAYKKSKHELSFGWFGNWTGVGASLDHSLAGLPDSTDLVSLWGGWWNPTPEKLADMHFVQKVKGTKFVCAQIITNMGSGCTPAPWNKTMDSTKMYWGWKDNDPKSQDTAVIRYANALCDTIEKYGYDGYDIDYEAHYGADGNLVDNDALMMTFMKALSKRFGPLSGTDKLLVIDGEVSYFSGVGTYFNYFISQAYGRSTDGALDGIATGLINKYSNEKSAEELASKLIIAENFESYASAGGVAFTDRYGNKMQSLEGFARWKPIVNGRKVSKGGVGTYHMEYEYVVSGLSGTYPYLRKAMKLMNPPVY